ncbi:uncharacterized protein MONBRDRAFT_11616 [Monosiga brevicollis MX1]|uniref:lactoylglutathione lyase n=1 Tax=Monosiga brevicollis TaxID=81824 RepID=A9V9T1_MONBE|nr:uncharacterized protein MONBRDRAFT_11616 [Monosiga brevicollis MX1]EDQ85719.1 predicted protein [Monosiga brevicollis MX1]|eukprot:XP_001749434.1 hypothetical protein [Monosiga brevicollis MX1]
MAEKRGAVDADGSAIPSNESNMQGQANNALVAVPAAKRSKNEIVLAGSSSGNNGQIVPSGPPRTSNLMAPVMRLEGHAEAVYAGTFSPSGHMLATAGFDRNVYVWNTFGNCENIMSLQGHTGAVLGLHWAKLENRLFSCSSDKTVAVWDGNTGERVRRYKGHANIVNDVAGPRDESPLFVTASDDNTIKIWDCRRRGYVHSMSSSYQVWAPPPPPPPPACRSLQSMNRCRCPDALTLTLLLQVTAVDFGMTNDEVVSGGIDNDVKVWDVRKLDVLHLLKGHTDTVTGLSVSPDGKKVATNSMDNTVRIWDIQPFAQGSRLQTTLSGAQHNYEKNLLRVAWAPDNRHVAAGSADRNMYVWNSLEQKLLYCLPGHKSSVNDVAFHPKEPIVMAAAALRCFTHALRRSRLTAPTTPLRSVVNKLSLTRTMTSTSAPNFVRKPSPFALSHGNAGIHSFQLIHMYKFSDFSLYFMASLPEGETCPEPGTKESEQFLWNMPYVCVELTHNHGTETDPEFKGYDSGNNEPHRGFGHLAIHCNDLQKTCDELEAKGVRPYTRHACHSPSWMPFSSYDAVLDQLTQVSFKKKPHEGRMKTIAFAYDPDGYWLEIIARPEPRQPERYTLAQTMLRVKDIEKSLHFYRDCMGMTVVSERHFGPDSGDFSLFFLAHLPEGVQAPADQEKVPAWLKSFDFPVLELTHNHGTESQADFAYHNGNSDPRGFGHTGFLVDDLEACCKDLEAKGYDFQKKPQDGKMRGLAFVKDPDNYWVELIQRGLSI